MKLFNQIRSFLGRHASIQTHVLPELYIGLSIVAGFFVELRHIVTSDWKNFFFNNSDMLTLPLVRQSIVAHEPFNWVFSSQIFLFPESIIYSFCSLLTPDFRLAMMLNSLIILLLTYVLLSWIARYFTTDRLISRLYAFLVTLGLILLTLLEPVSGNMAFATFYINTTTYYGVILSALAAIGLILHYIERTYDRSAKTSHFKRLLLGLFVIALLTSLSNPLFIFQFILPLTGVLLVGILVNTVRFRLAVMVLLPQFIGVGLSMEIRKKVLKSLFSPLGTVGSYLHFDQIGATIRTLKVTLNSLLHGSGQQRIEIYLILLGVASAFLAFLYTINVATRPHAAKANQRGHQTNVFLVRGLAGIAPLLVTSGIILTGNPLTRYLLPVILFPVLAILPLLSASRLTSPSMRNRLHYCLWGISAVALLAGAFSHPIASTKAVANYYPSDQQCLDGAVGNTSTTVGVAQYWRARGLQLNSRASLTIVQTQGALARFTWLYNSADYWRYRPSFVIVDKIPPPYFDPQLTLVPAFAITADRTVSILGRPTSIHDCNAFSVYLYPPSNPGNAILRQRLQNPNIGL